MTITLIEVERLVRKISALLDGSGNPGPAPKLAEDFSAICNAANLRLGTCELMLQRNDRLQTIQLAEATPNLLSLVTTLEFNSADEWREYCRQNALTVADPIDGRAVQALNACYAQGIAVDHELYKKYKTAVLERNDEEALKALRSITRLNPSDTNAVSELNRLEGKVLSVRLEHLAGSLKTASPEIIRVEVETIEGTGFKVQPEGEVWRRAQEIRCECLLDAVAGYRREALWMDAVFMLDFILSLQEKYKLTFQGENLRRFQEHDGWARAEETLDLRQREFKSLLKNLDWQIQQSEEKDTSSRYVPLPEMKEDYAGLHKIWRALTDFAWPIPGEVTTRFRKRSGLLELEIARRTAHKRRLVIAGVATILLVAGGVSLLVVSLNNARDYTRQLTGAVSRQNFRATENLLAQVGHEKLILPSASYSVALGDARSFVNQEQALLDNFETDAAALQHSFTNQPEADMDSRPGAPARLTQLARQFSTVEDALDKLCFDLKGEKTPMVNDFSNRWVECRNAAAAGAGQALETMLVQAEPRNGSWIYDVPMDQARTNLASFTTRVREITLFQSGFTNLLRLNAPVVSRVSALRDTLQRYNDDLGKFDDALEHLQQARNFDEFSTAVAALAGSPFAQAPEQKAAEALEKLGVSDENLLRSLLGVSPGQWSALKKAATPRFVPVAALPGEIAALNGLWNDPAVNGVYQHVRFQLANDPANTYEWIISGDFEKKDNWTPIKILSLNQAAGSVVFSRQEYFRQDGKPLEINPDSPQQVSNLEMLAPPNETDAFHGVGLEDFSGSSVERYMHPLLDVVDAVKESTAGSPLFRAYLYRELVNVMELNPDDWGVTFCPQLQADAARFQKEAGANLKSGDWFLRARALSMGDRLESFLKSVRGCSYAKQAAGIFELEHVVVDGGFVYAGYIGVDGRPVLVDNVAGRDLWGYDLAGQPAHVGTAETLTVKPLPFSPLFTLADTREHFLARASVNPLDPEFKNVLPPLFSASAIPGNSP